MQTELALDSQRLKARANMPARNLLFVCVVEHVRFSGQDSDAKRGLWVL